MKVLALVLFTLTWSAPGFASEKEPYGVTISCFVAHCQSSTPSEETDKWCKQVENSEMDLCISQTIRGLQDLTCSATYHDIAPSTSTTREIAYTSSCEILPIHSETICPGGTDTKPFEGQYKVCVNRNHDPTYGPIYSRGQ